MDLRLLFALLQLCKALVAPPSALHHAGVGIFDVTGPAAEVVLQGYATSEQKATGIHMRLHARAFIFVDPASGTRIAFVNVDTWSATEDIIQGLEARLLHEFGGLYTRQNVVVAGTHTHSAPGGTSAYALFQFSSLGHVQQSVDALVDGMFEAMKLAHGNIRPARIFIGNASVDNTTVPGCPMPNCAAINRSPSAYQENPAEERARYDGDVERRMDLIKIVDAKTGEPMGLLNWFAVHPTSMKRQNGLISGDNKGYAAYLLERRFNGPSSGRGPFVAGFAQGAAGDISPNINGSFCEGSDISCDSSESVCYDSNGNPHNSMCLSRGPGRNMFESTKIIGERQFLAAQHAFDTAEASLGTGVDSRMRFVDVSRISVQLPNGSVGSACPAAMGAAFAAGTTDGPSDMDDFMQHSNIMNPFLKVFSGLLATPPERVVSCQAPKAILLYTGGLSAPYDFVPSVIGLQLLRVGQLVIAAVPGEFTTMAGRRTREAIKEVLVEGGVLGPEGVVVLNNCAGGYADYVTTFEEYQHQRYEGGSTAYGPHTHEAWTKVLLELALDMAAGTETPPGAAPVLSRNLLETQTGVVADYPPLMGNFGDVRTDVPPGSFRPGDSVQVQLWGAHPRNDLRLNQTYGSVWRFGDGGWQLIADDNDPETTFEWRREGIAASIVTLTWYIPMDATEGSYKLFYNGNAKQFNQIFPITGSSRTFKVVM